MYQTEEQILIVHSVKGTNQHLIKEAKDAVEMYELSTSKVISVVVKAVIYDIPKSSSPGKTLSSELTKQLSNSIGAIIFLDDLRPNVAYELGFFHGQGKEVLLVTEKDIAEIWQSISDMAGCSLLRLNGKSLTSGIHSYLDIVYNTLSRTFVFSATEIPISSKNMLRELSQRAHINISLHESNFGPALRVDTWGGVIFETDFNLFPSAKFKIVLRSIDQGSTYSIFFHVGFRDSSGIRRTIAIGLTSDRDKTAFEANERLVPAQSLTKNWQLFTGTFLDLLRSGHVLDVDCVEHLKLIRVRAASYDPDAFKQFPSYEIGYIEIIGLNY